MVNRHINQGKKEKFLLNFPWKKNKKSIFKLEKGGNYWLFSLLLTNIKREYFAFWDNSG